MNTNATSIDNCEAKRIVFFAHFDKQNVIDDYVVYYLRRLRETATCIVFVSTSELRATEIAKIKDLCFKIIVRENVGYDFMSWKVALSSIDIRDYDELIICNDSVYGPLFSFEEVFAAMKEQECDFWGITGSHQWAYHIQSYFIVFKKSVFLSPAFGEFFSGVSQQKNKLDIISKYEVGLSQALIRAGFKAKTYIQYVPSFWNKLKYLTFDRLVKYLKWMFPTPKKEMFANLSINMTHFFWKDIITRDRMPFIKIELLRDNPKQVNIAHYDVFILKHSDYNPAFITRHLQRVMKNESGKPGANRS